MDITTKAKERIENGKCPNCGGDVRPVYENNGFEEPEGPRHDEIVGYECINCGRLK